MTYSKKNMPKQNIKKQIEECLNDVASADENKPTSKKAKSQNSDSEEDSVDMAVETTTRTTRRCKKTDTKDTKNSRKTTTTTTKKPSAAKKKKAVSMKKTVVEKCEASLASILAGFEEKERQAELKENSEEEKEEGRTVQSQESNSSGTRFFNFGLVIGYDIGLLKNLI